jgi:hypothetical protein
MHRRECCGYLKVCFEDYVCVAGNNDVHFRYIVSNIQRVYFVIVTEV